MKYTIPNYRNRGTHNRKLKHFAKAFNRVLPLSAAILNFNLHMHIAKEKAKTLGLLLDEYQSGCVDMQGNLIVDVEDEDSELIIHP